MENRPELGMNRTGLQMSPLDMQKMMEIPNLTTPSSAGDESALGEVRAMYIAEAEPVGTVPVPGTLRGIVTSGAQALTGKRTQVLMDKLGERLAFERTGTRIYQAFITKCEAPHEGPVVLDVAKLRRFCADEARHFQLLADSIASLGGDPTAQTPCADVAGVESAGLLQVVSDPQTTVNQSLHAILVGELTDHAGWEELISLTRAMGQDDMAQRFAQALADEREHLQHIREWHEQATLEEARLLQAQ